MIREQKRFPSKAADCTQKKSSPFALTRLLAKKFRRGNLMTPLSVDKSHGMRWIAMKYD